TREYEHLVLALRVVGGKPAVSYLPVPHPSGLAVDRQRGSVHVACTRNPNQVLELRPVTAMLERRDVDAATRPDRPLVPVRSAFYPGCLYLHDLALIDGVLHASATGENAIVRLHSDGGHDRAWW